MTSRKNRKVNALSASVLLATTALGYTGVSALNHTTDAETAAAPVAQDTTLPVTPSQGTTDTTTQYYDGEYYGDAFRAGRWGNMQVVAVIENGELTDVQIAAYPHSTSRSSMISRNAIPTLISEAIEAQDADIDFISRATDVSRAFIASLDSALLDATMGIDL